MGPVYPKTLGRRRATECKLQVPVHQETVAKSFSIGCPKLGEPRPGIGRWIALPSVQARRDWSHKFPEWIEPFEEGLSPPDSHNVVVEELLEVNPEEESVDLPSIANKSKRPNKSTPLGRHHVKKIAPQHSHCEVCKLAKDCPRAPCKNHPKARRDRAGSQSPQRRKRISLQHRCAVVVQDLDSCWIQCYPTKMKLRRER